MTDARMIITGPIAGHRLIALMEQLEALAEGEVMVLGMAGSIEIAMVDLEISSGAVDAEPVEPVVEPPAVPTPAPPRPRVAASSAATRSAILACLAGGPISEPNGRATRVLMERAGLTVTAGAATGMLARLEGEGLVRRSGNGKRTYEIALTGTTSVPPVDEPAPVEEPASAAGAPERETVEERRARIRQAAAAAVGQ